MYLTAVPVIYLKKQIHYEKLFGMVTHWETSREWILETIVSYTQESHVLELKSDMIANANVFPYGAIRHLPLRDYGKPQFFDHMALLHVGRQLAEVF